jgi:hypothetical protein
MASWMQVFGEVTGNIWRLGRGASIGSSGGVFGGGTEIAGGLRFLTRWSDREQTGTASISAIYLTQSNTEDLLLSPLISIIDTQDLIGAIGLWETRGPGLTYTLTAGVFYDLTNAQLAAEIGGKLRYEVHPSGWAVEAGFHYSQDVAGLTGGFRREFTLGGSYRFRPD